MCMTSDMRSWTVGGLDSGSLSPRSYSNWIITIWTLAQNAPKLTSKAFQINHKFMSFTINIGKDFGIGSSLKILAAVQFSKNLQTVLFGGPE